MSGFNQRGPRNEGPMTSVGLGSCRKTAGMGYASDVSDGGGLSQRSNRKRACRSKK